MSAPVINGAVRVGQTTYIAGQEDAFAKAASPAEIAHLTEKGAISGFQKSPAKPEPAEPATPAKAAKTRKKKQSLSA